MYLNTVFKYNVFKYCPALALSNNNLSNVYTYKISDKSIICETKYSVLSFLFVNLK